MELFREDIAEGFDVGIPYGESYGGPNRIELVVEDRTLETEDATVIDFPADNVMRITGASFYFAARIFVPQGPMTNLEGRLNIWGNPATDGRNRTWPVAIPDLRLAAGKWNYVSAMVPAHPEANTVWLRMRFRTFETGAMAYIDDLQLYELPRK